MKNILLAALLIGMMSSCTKPKLGDWVHFSSYNEYVILNNGDTVTYSDGFVMSGMTSGATKRQLTSEEQQMLLNHLDTICRTTVDPNTPFVDKGVKWRNMDSITGVKRTLDYWMKFQGHTINDFGTFVTECFTTEGTYNVNGSYPKIPGKAKNVEFKKL